MYIDVLNCLCLKLIQSFIYFYNKNNLDRRQQKLVILLLLLVMNSIN